MPNTYLHSSIDPYGQWALDTKLRRFRRTRIIDFLVELTAPVSPDIYASFEQQVLDFFPLHGFVAPPPNGVDQGVPPEVELSMPNAYFDALDSGDPSTFITLRMSVMTRFEGQPVPWDTVCQAVAALLQNQYVKRIQVGQPNYRWSDSRDDPTDPSLPSEEKLHALVVMGLLDDAIPFAHASLKGDGDQSRVVAVWDQGRAPGSTGWVAPAHFSYGSELRGEQMRTLNSLYRGEEDAIYSDVLEGRGCPLLRKRMSHGGMILPLMAGAQHAPSPPRWSTPDDERESVGRPDADLAATFPIIGVAFPALHTSDRSGRWMAVNALDGLRFILHRAKGYERDDERPVPIVINLSYGALAGAHDGTSMLESAIDELVYGCSDRLAVVLAAGNHHGVRRAPDGGEVDHKSLPCTQPTDLHARFNLKPGESQTLTLFVPPDKQQETSLEIWMHRVEAHGMRTLDENERLGIEVTAPDGQGLQVSGMGGSDRLTTTSGEPIAGLYLRANVPQSTQRSMALLVIAPTQVHRQLPSAAPGRWTVCVHNTSKLEIVFDAYVERDDTSVGARRDQAAKFIADAGAPLSNVDTLSDIATGSNVFRVGALQDDGAGSATAWVARYSSAGHVGLGPEFSALTDQGGATPGIRVSGSQSGMVVRANGTSLAAPQAARWIANELACNPSVTALRGRLPHPGTPQKGKKLLP